MGRDEEGRLLMVLESEILYLENTLLSNSSPNHLNYPNLLALFLGQPVPASVRCEIKRLFYLLTLYFLLELYSVIRSELVQ